MHTFSFVDNVLVNEQNENEQRKNFHLESRKILLLCEFFFYLAIKEQ